VPLTCAIQAQRIQVDEFNAHSVGNKSTSVCDWIADNSLHLAAVVRTWHDGVDSPELVACTPPSYRFVERARSRPDCSTTRTNYGVVCLFYVDNLHVRPVSLPDYDAFEHVCVYVQGSGFNTLVVVVYRPGSETVTDAFFVSLTDLLERTVTYKSIWIVGDINLHLDRADDVHTVKFQHVMSIFGLTQHIHSPKHRDGHTLDVLITRSDVVMQSVRVDPPLLSDHSAVIAIFDLPFKQDPSVARCVRRCWRSFDVDGFMHDIDQSSLIQSPTLRLLTSSICSRLTTQHCSRSSTGTHHTRHFSCVQKRRRLSGTTVSVERKRQKRADLKKFTATLRIPFRWLNGENNSPINELCSNAVLSPTGRRQSMTTDTTRGYCGRKSTHS